MRLNTMFRECLSCALSAAILVLFPGPDAAGQNPLRETGAPASSGAASETLTDVPADAVARAASPAPAEVEITPPTVQARRQQIEEAIASQGFQLWRMKSKTTAA